MKFLCMKFSKIFFKLNFQVNIRTLAELIRKENSDNINKGDFLTCEIKSVIM